MSGRRPTSARPTPARRSTSSERRGSVSETSSRKKMEEMEHDCKMAFLVVVDDLDDNLTSKEQLRNVLNQTGRNPSNRVLDKHWKPSTDSLSFEDVLQIARQIPVTSEDDLMKAFRKIDINGDGYISNDELFKVMTTRGDRMTRKEVQAIIDEVDENKDGRLDYKERGQFMYEKFCQMMLATQEECGKVAKQRYEKRRLKQDAQSKSKTKSPKEANGSTTSLSDDTSHRKSVEKQEKHDPMGSQVSLKSTASSASKSKKSEKRSGSLASLRSPSSERPSKVENEKDKMGSQTSLRSATGSRSGRRTPRGLEITVDANPTPRALPRLAPIESTKLNLPESSDSDSIEDETEKKPSTKTESIASARSRRSLVESIMSRTPRLTPRSSLSARKSSSAQAAKDSSDDSIAEEVSDEEDKNRNKLNDDTASSKAKDIKVSEKDLKASEVDKKVKDESPTKEVDKKDKEEIDKKVEKPEEKKSPPSVALQSTDKPISKASEPEKKDKQSESDDDDIVVGSQVSLRNGLKSAKKEAPSRSSSQTSLRSARSATKSDSENGGPPKPKPRKPKEREKDPNESTQSDDVKASPRPKDRTKSPVALKKIKLPEPKRLKDWEMTHSKGCFFFEDDGAIVSHQYMLQLSKDSSVWLTIEPFSLKTGGDLNSAREVGAPPIDTAAFILREKPDDEGNTLVTFTEQRDSKGRYCVRCDLEKGRYVILPFTTGCRFRQRKSEPKNEAKLVKEEKDDKYVLTKAFKETLSDIFELCDLDGNGLMNRDEFNWFNIRTSGEEVQDDEWDVVEDNVELKNGEITRNGFITLNQMEAEDNQGDTDDLWVTLNNMGYNKGLIQDEAVPFLVEVFAEDCRPTLKVTGINPAQHKLERAMAQIVTSKGEMTRVKNMKDLFLYTWMNDFRACVVVDNKSRSRVTLSIDCSKSRNCSTNRKDLDFTLDVSPKSTVVGHHILPSNERQEWCLRCIDTIVK